MKVFAFLYNSMTEESSWGVVSLHHSKEGAEKAMQEHKEKERSKWLEHIDWVIKEYGENCYKTPFGQFQDWCIQEMEVLD
jgi:hypothetical protein